LIDFDVSPEIVDAPGLRELVGLHPPLEPLEGEGVLGNPEILFEDHGMSSGHGEFYLLEVISRKPWIKIQGYQT
jgi:hypothetical protein